MNSSEALRYVEWIFFVGQTLVGVEFLFLYGRSWIFSVEAWKIVRKEAPILPVFFKDFLGFLLAGRERFFVLMLFRQLVLFLILLRPLVLGTQGSEFDFLRFIPSWAPMAIFLLLQQILMLYSRGNFNGGSDFMSFVVGTGILIARLSENSEERFAHAGLWYIALYSVSSYFVAGWVKLKSRDWLSGKALSGFMNSSILQAFAALKFLKNRKVALLASLSFLILECLFPLVWLGPSWAYAMLPLVFGFHLMNFLIFGLNRFVWIWAATYPAILYTSWHGL